MDGGRRLCCSYFSVLDKHTGVNVGPQQRSILMSSWPNLAAMATGKAHVLFSNDRGLRLGSLQTKEEQEVQNRSGCGDKSSSEEVTSEAANEGWELTFTAPRFKTEEGVLVCMYSALPESPCPGLSLSDLQLPAASAAVELRQVSRAYVDDDGGGIFFYVRSVIQTPVLDDRWDENVLTHKHVSYFQFTQTHKQKQWSLISWIRRVSSSANHDTNAGLCKSLNLSIFESIWHLNLFYRDFYVPKTQSCSQLFCGMKNDTWFSQIRSRDP